MGKIIGIDCVSGLPRERVITSPAVNEAITPAICEIITEIRAFLERIPPQIHKVILSEGIYLTGGSTHLPYIRLQIVYKKKFQLEAPPEKEWFLFHLLKKVRLWLLSECQNT